MTENEWRSVPLAAVVDQIARPVDVATLDVVPFAGVRWYAGGVYHRADEVAASVKTKRLNQLKSGDITYNRMWATKASFGVVGSEADGCLVTNDFPIFSARADLLPSYIRLVFQTPRFQSCAADLATGTTERRRLKEDAFTSIIIDLPPLGVQRRIVDVVEGVDANLASLAIETEALAVVLQSLLEEWRAEGQAATGLPVLGDLALIRSGPSWAADEESDVASEGATRVIKITNTKQDGSLDLTGRTYVTGLPTRTILLDGRSLIVIRTNGNRERIGNVYRPSVEALGCAVSAFQFIVQARDEVARDRIYWALRAPGQQAAMSEAASGTTGLGNLAAGWLKTQPIAELNEHTRVALEDIDRQLTQLRSERDGLRFVRTQLLHSLMSGAVEIPAAYDRLVDVGVA